MKLRDYLIASETNDYKPWIITPAALAVFCLTIWSLRILIPANISLAQNSIDSYDVMNRINKERTNRFIPALTTNSKLISAATGKANDMLARSYFSHIDPDGNYVWDRITAAGYTPYLRLGENLAMDFTSAADVVREWMNSPTHRENIVNAKFYDQGLASISGNYEPNHDTIMIVSLFGALQNATAPTQPGSTTTPPKTTSTTPAPKPVVKNPSPATSNLKISNDIKVTSTFLSGKILVDIDAVIAGSPTLVNASLAGQSITLLAGDVAGQFVGRFTFDASADLIDKTLNIEARDKAGAKATLEYAVSIDSPAESTPLVGDANSGIPLSSEAQIFLVLKIIFGVLAVIYMGFLTVDAVILHRAKIKREAIHSNPHLLVFALVAAVSLLSALG